MAGQQPRGGPQQRQQQQAKPPPAAATPEKKEEPKVNLALPATVPALNKLFAQMGPHITAAIPRTVKLDSQRLSRLVLTTVQKTPDLMQCTAGSILGSLMQAAALGLECDGTLGHAYLIPFKRTCTLLIGYRGYIVLAMRTDQVSSIFASAVYADDAWQVELGTDPFIKHVPRRPDPAINAAGAIARGIVAFYAVCKMKDGSVKFEWMWKEDVDAIRARSRAGQSGPWVTDYVPMGAKTAIRKLCKTLGLSAELTRASVADEEIELGVSDASLVDYEMPAAIAEAATQARREELRDQYKDQGGDAGGADTPTSSDGDPNEQKGGELFQAGAGPDREPGADDR